MKEKICSYLKLTKSNPSKKLSKPQKLEIQSKNISTHQLCAHTLPTLQVYKHPAGPETVPIKRTFLKKMVILPQCRADLMIGNPGKTWGAFFRFSASSLQRMRSKQLAVSILVNASPLPSSSIHHQEVTFGTQFSGN